MSNPLYRIHRSLLVLLSCFLMTLPIEAQKEELRVLFIGNSYTYFWNLPQTVEAMSEQGSVYLNTRQSTEGGVNLSQHWRSKKQLGTMAMLDEHEYDIVVLQDHSMQAIKRPDSLQHYGKLFAELCKEKNAKVFLYMTWSRKWDPFMIEDIASEYEKLAESTGAVLVPVGLAWSLSIKERPNLDLYDVDETHPSPEGTYLNACVFYGALTGQSPVGLPERIIGKDSKGDKLYLNIQSEENALFLQRVAARSLGLDDKKAAR